MWQTATLWQFKCSGLLISFKSKGKKSQRTYRNSVLENSDLVRGFTSCSLAFLPYAAKQTPESSTKRISERNGLLKLTMTKPGWIMNHELWGSNADIALSPT